MGDWFVYVLRCGDDSLYTGIARSVAARLAMHVSGRGARYTRGRLPLNVAAQTRCASQGDALRIEHAFRTLPRKSKVELLKVSSGLRTFALKLLRRRKKLAAKISVAQRPRPSSPVMPTRAKGTSVRAKQRA